MQWIDGLVLVKKVEMREMTRVFSELMSLCHKD
jgi:hypothetical protein